MQGLQQTLNAEPADMPLSDGGTYKAWWQPAEHVINAVQLTAIPDAQALDELAASPSVLPVKTARPSASALLPASSTSMAMFKSSTRPTRAPLGPVHDDSDRKIISSRYETLTTYQGASGQAQSYAPLLTLDSAATLSPAFDASIAKLVLVIEGLVVSLL